MEHNEQLRATLARTLDEYEMGSMTTDEMRDAVMRAVLSWYVAEQQYQLTGGGGTAPKPDWYTTV